MGLIFEKEFAVYGPNHDSVRTKWGQMVSLRGGGGWRFLGEPGLCLNASQLRRLADFVDMAGQTEKKNTE